MCCGTLDSSSVLLPHSTISPAYHITIILTSTHLNSFKYIHLPAVLTRTRKGERDTQLRRVACFGKGAHGRLGNGKNSCQTSPALVTQWLPSLNGVQVSLRFKGLRVYCSILVVSCFRWSGALDSSGVPLSYPITSLASTMTNILISDIYSL